MTRQLNFSFEIDIECNIAQMKLQQVVPLSRKSDLVDSSEGVPDEIVPLLGNYWLSQAQADFKVFYENGVLKIAIPLPIG